jgi:hypothetical protein
MANYAPSTRARIADLITGMRVETSVLANVTYLHQDQWEAFNVYGRIMVLQLYFEAITVNGAGASLFQYNFTSSSPAIGVQPMGAVSASIATLAQGLRCVWVGGAVSTAHVITATAGISDVVCNSPQIIGTADGTGTIGFVTSVADAVSGTHQHVLHYIPMDDGAYVSANL